jgi:CheY-like chemotaxis protein
VAKKILVIDDEELIVRSLAKLLEKSGYDVFVVKTGEDALVVVEEESFDLIISDIRMPGMTGVEAVEQISGYLSSNKQNCPPVIFITGYADKECEAKAKKLNPAAYILKPFDVQDLVSKIADILK